MNEVGFNVKLADVNCYDWESALIGAQHPICSIYAQQLVKRFKELEQNGDEKGARVFRFLGAVASLALRAEEIDSPFLPFIVWENHRSAALEDFGTAEMDILEGLLLTTRDPAMRARFGDLLWITRKDHKAARIAAESYLESFKRMDLAKAWGWDIESFRRGFYLASLLGKKNEPFVSYVTFTEGLIDAKDSTETQFVCASLMELLLDRKVGDFERHAAQAEHIAESVETSGNFLLAQRYLELAVKLHLAAKNKEAARQDRLRKGNSLVRQAESVINSPGQGYIAASYFLAMGIECLRQSQGPEDKIQQLHKQLRVWQEASLKEMQTFSHKTNITEMIEAARNHVHGKSLVDSLLAFTLRYPLTTRSQLREQVIKNAGQFPLSHMMGPTMMSHDGRFLNHKPPVIIPGKDEDEAAIEAEMIYQAKTIDWPLRVSAYIEPCRFEIYQEHRPSLRDLAFLVEHNPFIPQGHEVIFLRGIHAGFSGDMMLCAHLLVPQIEEAIRHVLRRSGIVTSKLDSKLVQEERLLGVLLAMPETIQIFGEDCVFELRAVLCEKFGFDLRNRLAHGFITEQECFGDDVMLMWWLVLRLCIFPVYQALSQQPIPPPEDGNTSESSQVQSENPPST